MPITPKLPGNPGPRTPPLEMKLAQLRLCALKKDHLLNHAESIFYLPSLMAILGFNPPTIHLVGGIPTPLKNMNFSWDDHSQYMEKQKMFQTTSHLPSGNLTLLLNMTHSKS